MGFIKAHWKTALKVAGFLLLYFAAKGFQAEREARIRLDGEVAAKQEIITAQNEVLMELDQRIAAREKDVAEQRAAIEKLKARPATVREIVREIPRYIPMANPPELFTAELGAPYGPQNPSGAVASAVQSDSLLFDASAANDLRRFYLECSQVKVELGACQEDRSDYQRKEAAHKIQLQATEAQRDAAIRTVKGGSFWRRVAHDGKMLAIGAAAGAVVAVVAMR